MRQVVVKKGKLLVANVPAPNVTEGNVLVRVQYSCVSSGTEKMSVSQSRKSLLRKAVEQPQKISQAVEMCKSNGVTSVIQKVNSTTECKALGYSASGIVIEVGNDVNDIKIGDKVAVAGVDIANHAEIVSVPRNLLAKVPMNLGLLEASTVSLGSISMQGVRRMTPQLGETIIVFGLGVLGQLAAQMLAVCGCHVIGVDTVQERVEFAKKNGCEYGFTSVTGSNETVIREITDGRGVDGVLITAATDSRDILNQCFNITRQKGKVILLGVVECTFDREIMYQRELDFGISCSYGPGRYDEKYEVEGIDYPYAYVRWTENRNMEEYLRLLSLKRVDISEMLDSVRNIENVQEVYDGLNHSASKPVIPLLKYERSIDEIYSDYDGPSIQAIPTDKNIINVAIVGLGKFAKNTHLPNLSRMSSMFSIYAVMSRTGLNAKNIADQYHAQYSTTDYNTILDDKNVDLIIICTRHNLHAQMTIEALKHGKSVLLEKPLAINLDELSQIKKATIENKGLLMVGYNRRFSPVIQKIKKELSERISPVIINYTVNAGYIPLDNWVHTDEGGGRVIGEACHIVDVCSFIINSKAEEVSCTSIKSQRAISSRDNVVITIGYEDGSIANIVYSAMGNTDSVKEQCKIFCDGKTIKMDDYMSLEGYGTSFRDTKFARQSKGHIEELECLYEEIRKGNRFPIPWDKLEETSTITIIAEEQCRKE